MAAPLAGGAEPAGAVDITSIAIERDCNGCPTGGRLLLKRSGVATLALTGKARMGTQATSSSGSVTTARFDALALLVLRNRFFEMDDAYDDAETRDGPWTTVTVERGSSIKQVFARDGAAPAALQAIHAAIDATQSTISFSADGPRAAR